ncbi:MarR family winged helix-turn-helix transcriptional regulator [Halobacillus salinus]|uniref:MarR family winged helix-turn-helix transcriptional regulator n=1 Tax=Halobacillus salinus TaxID=192814 RepID=UPI0009A5D13A|nr:MarR family transcriptional regulator [Halobacillus salinus]
MEVQDSYGFLLAKVEEAMESRFVERLKGLNINAKQFGVLQYVEKNPGSSQIDVSKSLLVDRTTMVSHVDFLESIGLIKRERNPNDRRSFVLSVTTDGEQVLQRGRDYLQESESNVLAELNEQEQDTLKNLLLRILGTIRKEENE